MPSRRPLIALVASAALVLGGGAASAQDDPPETPPAPLRSLDLAPFEAAIAALSADRRAALDELVPEATIRGLTTALDAGDLTSAELATYYLARIADHDVGGLRSLNELNPDALTQAMALDEERASGNVRGPLHGIPISLKDNIGTGDDLHTTAGAAALRDARSDRDAFIVERLRDAGAVIVGKANMSEWAGFMQIPGQPAGFSALGGQVANPYGPDFSPSGSSAGSAVSVSANLVTASVGTETMGSLIAPASVNGIVAVKPSLGLVSRDRIIPITDQTDTAGPLARSVEDAATMLAVMVGSDDADPVTELAAGLDTGSFIEGLAADALEGVRVGFHVDADEPPGEMTEAEFFELIGYADAIAGLEAAGAHVEIIWSRGLDNVESFTSLGVAGLKLGVADYLAATDPDGPILEVADVVAFNEADPARFAPYGQSALVAAAGLPAFSREEYEAEGAKLRAEAQVFLDDLLEGHEVDVIASRGNRLSSAYAIAGYPAVTVPAGRRGTSEAPLGLTFVGAHLEDAKLLSFAYAYEQATKFRQPPSLD